MTNLVRFSPGYELRQMQREIDRLFNGFLQGPDGQSESDTAVWSPRVDLAENDDAYVIYLDLPGTSKDALDINYQEGRLTVSGERHPMPWEEGFNVVRLERTFGRFYRSFSLPKAVLHDKIEAHFEDGVLSIYVPKAEESKPRRIEIK